MSDTTLSERTRITEFAVLESRAIAVRKTTEILRGEAVISSTHWRCVLAPNDAEADAVLGQEPYYLALAQAAWAQAEA